MIETERQRKRRREREAERQRETYGHRKNYTNWQHCSVYSLKLTAHVQYNTCTHTLYVSCRNAIMFMPEGKLVHYE